MEKYKCITKRCRKEPEVKVLGKWHCWSCWLKHCKGDLNV